MKSEHDISKKQIRNWLRDASGDTPSEQEVEDTEQALLAFAEEHRQLPPAGLREKILNKIGRMTAQRKEQEALDIHDLPMLDASANWLAWQQAIRHLAPPVEYEQVHLHPLVQSDTRDLYVIWAKEYVEEEIHYDLLESFLILEGSCECHITDEAGQQRTVRLCAGDFLALQIGETHDLIVTSSEPAKAILQRLKSVA